MRPQDYVAAVILFMILALILPHVSIWAVNTLFQTNIQHTVWTWLAALWFLLLIGAR